MTPNDLEILIHFHCSHAPHPRNDAPAVRECIGRFAAMSVIQQTGTPNCFSTTEMGSAWVVMILQTPMPVQKWIDPRFEESDDAE